MFPYYHLSSKEYVMSGIFGFLLTAVVLNVKIKLTTISIPDKCPVAT